MVLMRRCTNVIIVENKMPPVAPNIKKHIFKNYSDHVAMDILTTRLHISTMGDFKAGSAVCLAELSIKT